jgi:hypothetical protein
MGDYDMRVACGWMKTGSTIDEGDKASSYSLCRKSRVDLAFCSLVERADHAFLVRLMHVDISCGHVARIICTELK